MHTAEEIARRYLGGDASWSDLERDILRHMEHHIKLAVLAEREACAKLILSLPAGFGDLNRNDVAERIRNRRDTQA